MKFLRTGALTPFTTYSEKNILLRASLAALLSVSLAVPVNAQTTTTTTVPTAPSTTTEPAAPEKREVEKVEVIGTRIRRVNVEGPSAVKSIKKEVIENSGTTTVSDILRDTSAASGGVTREASGGNAAAVNNIGLRGLGSNRTLILLNGRRLPKDPTTEAVDLNLIPQSAVERVEILKDGSSALYGSDALGGVINFVTKKNFTGNEVQAFYSKPKGTGGENSAVSLLHGSAGERSEFILSLSYTRKERVYGKDRELTKDGLSPNGSTAAYNNGTTWAVTPEAECPPDLLRTSSTGKRCYFRFNEIATTRPEIAQFSLLTDYTYRTDSSWKIYNRNIVVMKDIAWVYAPTPDNGYNLNFPTGIPSNANAKRISYRFMEAGNRENEDKEKNFSLLFGTRGNVTDVWEADVSVGFSRVDRKNVGKNGYIDKTAVKNLIQNGTFNPLAPKGTRGDMTSAKVETSQVSVSDLSTLDVVFSGEVGEMENGAIGAAVGVSAFGEKLVQTPDEKLNAGEVLGSSGSSDNGSRNVTSAFGEFSLPVSPTAEINLAARADNYSDFGSTINPKVAGKIKVSDSTLLRASVGTGFKAPTLIEINSARSEGFQSFIDRKRCAADPTDGCSEEQYFVISGGNKDLKEEKAVTAGIGAVYEPSGAFSTSLDVWYTKMNNVVGIDFEELTRAELKGVDTTKYGVTVARDANGLIDQITAPNLNLQEVEVSGVDLNMDYLITDDFFGHKLNFQDDLSYTIFENREGFPGAGKRNVIGEWGSPAWRNGFSFIMKKDVITYILSGRTIPGQKVSDREKGQNIQDYTEMDIAVSYKVSDKGTLGFGLRNMFDTNPPADFVSGLAGEVIVNSSLYDFNGRTGFVSYTQKF
jgi:iron complex outermembrane recepter protein